MPFLRLLLLATLSFAAGAAALAQDCPSQPLRIVVASGAGKANKWSSPNRSRWSSPECDELHKAAQVELDPVKRAALFIRMNDLVVGSGYVIPVISTKGVRATANKLNASFSRWEVDTWALGAWSRDA